MNGKRQSNEGMDLHRGSTPTRKTTGISRGSVGKGPNKKPKGDWKERILRIAIISVAVLLALSLGVLAWWRSFATPPKLDLPLDLEGFGQLGDIGELDDIGAPVRLSGDRKQDFYTFLIIGRDTGGGGNTDTILLVAYDLMGQEMSVLSIPRDTMVNVSWDVKKINSVYNNYGGGDKGIAALSKEMAQLVGFTPDYQVVLEWKAVGELVDALGGVTYDVPRKMYYNDPGQDLHINIKKGLQTLNGEQAMQVVRFRDGPNGYANGDLGRIETQQGFLKAVIEQCLQISNITRINALTQVFKDNVSTNLDMGNIAWFAEKAVFGGLTANNVHFYTLPCTGTSVWSRSYGQKLSYVVPETNDLVALINESFNPYKEDLRENELDIMFVNANGTIGSSAGKLEDSKANGSLSPNKKTEQTTKPSSEKTEKTSSGKDDKPSTSKDDKPSTSKDDKPSTSKDDKPSTSKDDKPSTSKDDKPSTSKDDKPSSENGTGTGSAKPEETPPEREEPTPPTTEPEDRAEPEQPPLEPLKPLEPIEAIQAPTDPPNTETPSAA